MRDPQVEPLPFGKFRYPTRYFVTVRNETTAPVWVDIEWRFPGDDPHPRKGMRLETGKALSTWRNTFGVIEDQPIGLRFTVYADESRAVSLGSEDTFMRFAKPDKEAFLKNFSRSQGLPLISGWPEMGAVADSIPGTVADRALRFDIQLLLWKEESKHHRDCTHEVLRADSASLQNSTILAEVWASDSAAAGRLLERTQGTTQAAPVRLERWLVRSCDVTTAYEVLLNPASTGGTDILVRKAQADRPPVP